MRAKAGAGVAAVIVMLGLVAVTPAHAVDIIESQEPGGHAETAAAGWQAGTCTGEPCSAETPNLFFTQAAGHPPDGFTQIIVKHTSPFPLSEEPVGNLKTILVDLPPGLSVNPQATPQCELSNEKFPSGGCPADTQVGEQRRHGLGCSACRRDLSRFRSTTWSPDLENRLALVSTSTSPARSISAKSFSTPVSNGGATTTSTSRFTFRLSRADWPRSSRIASSSPALPKTAPGPARS